MPSLSKQLIAVGLLATTTEASKLNSQEAASLLTTAEGGNCPLNPDVCGLSFKRLMDGNNSNDYQKFSAQKNVLYKDASFPAGPGSLFWNTATQKGQASYAKWTSKTVSWARPSQMQSADPNLWSPDNETRPSAAQQGGLGDCWFLAATSALAEFPDRVKAIFTNTQYSNVGVFQTKWYIQGQEVRVTIDDRLPVDFRAQSRGNQLPRTILSRKSPMGSWWLPLLEKSFAKVNVNYAGLNGGMMNEAWRQMTNQPVGTVATKNYRTKENLITTEQAWTYLSEWDKKNYVISTACFSGANGLVSGHAYTIIGVKTLNLGNGKTQRLVKARNPWGSEKYSGKWGRNSNLWTTSLKAQAGEEGKNDGIFYVPIEEFLDDFQTLQYIAWNDDWKVSSAKVSDLAGGSVLKGTLKVGTTKPIMFQCDQAFTRYQPSSCNNKQADFTNNGYTATSGLYMIYNSSGQRATYGWCQGGNAGLTVTLPKGDYTITLTNRGKGPGNLTLSTYSEDVATAISLQ